MIYPRDNEDQIKNDYKTRSGFTGNFKDSQIASIIYGIGSIDDDSLRNKKDNSSIYSMIHIPEIKEVIFKKPYTIILWDDETYTRIKCDSEDKFDKDKGVAMCMCKKIFGDKYYSIIRKWIKKAK